MIDAHHIAVKELDKLMGYRQVFKEVGLRTLLFLHLN
jgi:hypothetical protein